MQYPSTVVFIIHVDKIDNDNAAEVTQTQLTSNGLRCFNISIKDSVVEITMPNKRSGIDIDGGHCFSLIDDQIAARFQFNLAFQRALDFILNVKEIKNGLAPAVMFQLAGHLGDIFRCELQQRFIGQTRVNADPVKLGIGKITQHALRQRQFAVHLVARLRALFTLHDFSPDALQVGSIRGQILLTDAFRRCANNESALFIAVIRHHFFQAFAFGFAFDTLGNANVRSTRHKDEVTGRKRDVRRQACALSTQRIFYHLHHQILALAHQFRNVAHGELFLFFTRHAFGVRHDV